MQQLFVMVDVLFEGSAGIDIVAYEDYCDGPRLLRQCSGTRAELNDFAQKLRAGGGGDAPEAAKTALNRIVEDLRARNGRCAEASSRSLVVHYTDAPPHSATNRDPKSNNAKERKALEGKDPGFDFASICRVFRELGAPVITFMPSGAGAGSRWFWALLGECVILPSTDPNTITKFTMGVLLRLMGQPFGEIRCARFEREPDLSAYKGETDLLLAFEGRAKLAVGPFEFQEHQAFSRDLRGLPKRFTERVELQDLVFEALKDLLVPERVLALTYNSVLGTLWRCVCRRREDPRLAPLCDALSACCQKLSGEAQAQLRAWVDESYDQAAEICELISAVEGPLEEGILVLDAPASEVPSKDEMRSLLHAPSPGLLSKVQGLLTRLSVVRRGALPIDEERDGLPMFVPLALKDKDLFSVLSHLLLPGMMLSLRPAAMLAILAHLSGNAILQPRAQRFLESWKGAWIPPVDKVEEYPEVLNAEFVRLVSRVPEFLTEAEQELYGRLRAITRLRQAASLGLEAEVGFSPKKTELSEDTKLPCDGCGHRRSFTLLVNGMCGLCLSNPEEGAAAEEPAADRSHLVECRTCKALYAVVRVADLNVEPKCHYCRQGETAPVACCELCGNKYCDPSGLGAGCERFVCAVCSARGGRQTPSREAPLAALVEMNPLLMRLLGFEEKAAALLFGRLGLFKLWTQHGERLGAVEAPEIKALVWEGKPVMNVPELLEVMLQRIRHGSLSATCNLCFTDRALPALQSACGQCSNLACGTCLRSWYGRLAPGRLYVPSEGLCAFCKRTPKAATLRSFNRLACRLSGRRSLELDAGMYYGWCRTCFKIKEAVPRDCAREAPDLQSFECQDCKVEQATREAESGQEALRRLTKPCPKCKAPTMKWTGCDHISCTQCGAHWCWRCGGHFDEEDIYEHMDAVHGTIGVEDGVDFESDDE